MRPESEYYPLEKGLMVYILSVKRYDLRKPHGLKEQKDIAGVYAGEIRKNQALPKRQKLVKVWF